MNIILLVPISTHFQLMMYYNLADINGCSSKCPKCQPCNQKYLGEAHVRSPCLLPITALLKKKNSGLKDTLFSDSECENTNLFLYCNNH